MNSMPPKDEEHADDIVPSIAYEAPLPLRKEFLPWHMPRKQYVRHHQWRQRIERLLNASVITSNPATYDHLKTGQRAEPRT
jgi:hypothetical protein